MLAIANVALRRFLRERSNLFFVFVLPFLIIFLVGYAAGSGADAPMAIVGADTELGSAVVENLPSESFVLYDETDSALKAVGETEVSAAVIFPGDPTEPITFRSRSGVGLESRADLDAAVATANQRLVVDRQAERAGVDSTKIAEAEATTPATPVVTEKLGQTAAGFLVQDRQLGMTTRKASAPISIQRLVAGETLGRLWISLFQAVLIVAVTALMFEIGWGDPISTGTILFLFALVSTGTGILLGTVFDNPEGANGTGIMMALVLAALGGAMAPVEIFPDVMQTIARFTPHFWAIDGLQTSLTGGRITDVAQPVAILAAFAVGILVLSTTLYRRRAFKK